MESIEQIEASCIERVVAKCIERVVVTYEFIEWEVESRCVQRQLPTVQQSNSPK